MADRVKTVSGDAVQDIFDVQHQWVEALVKADTAMLDAILVDSYVDTDEGGSRLDKAGVLAALKSGDLKLASITLLETHVQRYGDSAVLTGISEQTGAFQGQSIAPKILFTATLIFQNGKWRAVAAHRTAMPDH
jgi:ketosteroid isomerase-like protein